MGSVPTYICINSQAATCFSLGVSFVGEMSYQSPALASPASNYHLFAVRTEHPEAPCFFFSYLLCLPLFFWKSLDFALAPQIRPNNPSSAASLQVGLSPGLHHLHSSASLRLFSTCCHTIFHTLAVFILY